MIMRMVTILEMMDDNNIYSINDSDEDDYDLSLPLNTSAFLLME